MESKRVEQRVDEERHSVHAGGTNDSRSSEGRVQQGHGRNSKMLLPFMSKFECFELYDCPVQGLLLLAGTDLKKHGYRILRLDKRVPVNAHTPLSQVVSELSSIRSWMLSLDLFS
ncbi:hypothetical protein NGA_0129700 [Nannochloropsis gaditana CCMP526]|uniref:uncharacterized protein n=1 Tax=Nannochloropsis gaditana (strain CCMP526) TaxID=1093141 RepID=UPI00029F5D9F|nr:hypothetical protein NGA_0129700 [Nannochloropsis gaditana CCMP526]EKU21189.1 hypothetical protein NGA_0129700 [Nannochloropsis gaditana CCMP526]|eukprot:XP_005855165.1 hypothetical protein NGA_0129700 [Nannochloropsis gaditana CCMP526]